jgi:hypothetical protein
MTRGAVHSGRSSLTAPLSEFSPEIYLGAELPVDLLSRPLIFTAVQANSVAWSVMPIGPLRSIGPIRYGTYMQQRIRHPL